MDAWSKAGPEESCLKLLAPSGKAKYPQRPIVNQYRKGKVKKHPKQGRK